MLIPRVSNQAVEYRGMLTQLYEEHAPLMLRAAFQITGNHSDAEDAIHDVFVKLIEVPEPLQKLSPDEKKGFLLACVKNRSLDIVRAKKRISHEALDENIAIPERGGFVHESGEAELLKDEMSRLPLNLQSILVLHYHFGYRFHEIGRLLGLSTAAVQKAAYRAKKLLRQRLRED